VANNTLKVPSLQQVIKNLNDSSEIVQRALLRTHDRPPRISYKMLHRATQDRVCLDVPLSQIEAGIRKAEKRLGHAENLIAIMRLLDGHFGSLHPDFPPIDVECRYYPIAPDIRIPFQPPICYGIGGQTYIPYLNFWRKSPLKGLRGKRLSVFMTIIDEIRRQDPGIEKTVVPILDFSIPDGQTERTLVIRNEADIVRVSPAELKHWLQIFADGYRGACAELARRMTEKRQDRETGKQPDDGQSDMFN
jgi:hypothetical protein